MEELKLGIKHRTNALEKIFLEKCLSIATQMTALAIGLPMLTNMSRAVLEILQPRGNCCIFRVRGEARDAERFTTVFRDLFPDETEADSVQLAAKAREEDFFFLIDDAHLLKSTDELGELLQRVMMRCTEQMHFLFLAPQPIAFFRQADTLPLRMTEIGPDSLLLNSRTTDELLQQVYPSLLERDRKKIFKIGGGWLSATEAAAWLFLNDEGDQPDVSPKEQVLSAVNDLLENWTAAMWTQETMECMEKVCVERELTESLALLLTQDAMEPLRRLARRQFLVRSKGTLESAYYLNPILQAWLYHRVWRLRGKGFLMEQHRIAAVYGQEREDWQLVFYHQLRRGYAEDAALTLRYLGFSELNASLLYDYRQLLRKMSPAAIDKLPWVQLGYAIAVKYRYPNIAFRYLDRAIELFRNSGDREGLMLAACQKISMGFFAPEQKAATTECLQILAAEDFQDGDLDPVMDGYRKVFTAYAIIQLGADYQRAIELQDQAREVAIIRESENLRLWVCFVMILTYKDCQYEDGLKTILDEALELVESPEVQRPLKMCLYQTVAFLCYIEGGRYEEARSCCEHAARIADEIGAYGYSVYINMVHAYALDCLGRFQRAEQVILETPRVSGNILNIRNEHLWAYYLIGQSYHYFLKGDLGLALDMAEKAAFFARRSGRNSYLTRALLVSGNIEIELGHLDQAEAFADECIKLCNKKKYRFYQLSTLFLKAQIYRARGEVTKFENCMAQLAEGGREAGIFHYNFAKPETICQIVRSYHPSEKDKNYFLQLETCNTVMEKENETAPILESYPHTPLEVQILGSLVVQRNGEPLETCASAKATQLIRILALHSEPVSVHKLLADIWPEWDEKTAMNNFYFTLYQLRAYLGEKNAVIYKRGLCSFDCERVTVDSILFQELAGLARKYLAVGNLYAADHYFGQAFRLVRGPVLDGDDLSEDALIQREVLERFIYTVLRDFGAVCVKQRRPDKAEQVLSVAVKNAFSEEETYRLLIKAQYLAGNKSGALTTYEKLREQLHAELQVEPHSLTRELADRIRRNQETAGLEDE